jgi:NAD(P) transhydrogenase subunit alpha
MNIAIPKEKKARENRVALTPEVVKNLVEKGFRCAVEKGAGDNSYFSDDAYSTHGASIVTDVQGLYRDADVVLKVNAPTPEEISWMRRGAALISFMYASGNPVLVTACVNQGISVFSMDALPRISRAQKMDALSSQSNLAGYKAVVLAANTLGKIFPLLMTAAGAIRPSKVLVMGTGVAGLQAIATAKRLGAVVEATDIRPETKEQVESLGAKFIDFGDASVRIEGGYVKDASEDVLKKQREVIALHVKEADIVITTALVPGKKAPLLVSEDMVKSMRRGSVIVDMAVEQGGNCAGSERDKTVVKHGVTIIGESNLPGLLPLNASELYARNISALLTHLAAQDGFIWDMDDEITKGTLITHEGKAMHPSVAAVFANGAGSKKVIG